MPDSLIFDVAPAAYLLRGVFPLDLLTLFAVMVFGFWTVAVAAWGMGVIGKR